MNKYELGWEFEDSDIRQTVEIPQWELSIDDVINQIVSSGKDTRWGLKPGGSVVSKPIIHEGAVYFGANDFNFYALDAETGRELWRHSTGGIASAWSSAAVWKDRIFFTNYDGNLYCLKRKDGSLVWKFGINDMIACTPLIVEGRVIFGSRDMNLYAVSAETGREIWKVPIGKELASHPVIHEGSIYIGSPGGVHRISIGGRLIWSREVDGDVNDKVGALGDRIMFGSSDGNVYCYSLSGKRLWAYPTNGPLTCECITVGENAILGSFDQNYYCMDKAGRLVWKFPVDGIAYTCYVTSDRVYLPSFRNRIYCCSREGKLLWKKAVPELDYISGSDKILVAATWDCKVIGLSKKGKRLWEFRTSMSQPSEVEFVSPEDAVLEVVHVLDSFNDEAGKPGDEKELGSYGDFKGQYIQDDMRDYIGQDVKKGSPMMKYKTGKGYGK